MKKVIPAVAERRLFVCNECKVEVNNFGHLPSGWSELNYERQLPIVRPDDSDTGWGCRPDVDVVEIHLCQKCLVELVKKNPKWV